MRKIKYQLLKILVSQAGEQVRFQAETDKLYDKVLGMYISAPSFRNHNGSTLEMKIAEDEIFPEGFETKLLASTLSVAPNQRFVQFDQDETVKAKGNLIVGKYTDGGLDANVHYPHTIVLYFKLKKEPQSE